MTEAFADAIVVAAGSSRRMGGEDKMAARLGGRPLLAWTLDAIAASPIVDRIVVVRDPTTFADGWPSKVVATVPGGTRRQDSVAAGLAALEAIDDGPARSAAGTSGASRVVLVHDGARPLLTPALVERVASAAAEHGAAIPTLPVTETLKRVRGDVVVDGLDRTDAAAAQTPQGFRRDVLAASYARLDPRGADEFTDDAALVAAAGFSVHVVPGEPDNLKVTHASDLDRAEQLIERRREERIGLGEDSHPFGPGEPLRLGGIEIPGAPRLRGHSDGDAALHAIAGALLGAAGLGDLGTMFPADDRTPRGVSSADLLAGVRLRLADAGWVPVAVDLTIVGSRPRLASHLDRMRVAIAGVLGVPRERVSVKGSTGNLSGDVGAGRAIAARALATVGRSVDRR